MSKVIHIDNNVEIGTGDVELYLNVTLDATGEVLINKKADSLVANFLRILMSFMGNQLFPNGLFFNSSDSEGFPSVMRDYGETSEVIVSVVPGNPTRVNLDNNMVTFNGGGTQGIQIMGVGGITPDINGFHAPGDFTYVSDDEIDIDIDTTGSPAFVDEGATTRLWQPTSDSATRSQPETLGGLIIKAGRSMTANVTDQQSLLNEYSATNTGEDNKLSYTTPSISAPAYNSVTGTSQIFISSIVTNNTPDDLDIGEIGLYAKIIDNTNDNRYTLIARDTVNTTLSAGSSATINYAIQTALTGDGGLLKQFAGLLYRQFLSGASFTVTDANGATSSVGNEEATFMAVATSGSIKGTSTSNNGETGDKIGPQVGTGTTAVTIDDYALETRIANGEDSGQLFYHAPIIRNFQIIGSVASFELSRIFENYSGGDITINEIAIYTLGYVTNGAIYDPTCIYREVLSSPITLADGELLNVKSTLSLTVA